MIDESNSKSLSIVEQRRLMPEDITPTSMMFDPYISAQVVEAAKTMAKGYATVPEHLRGNVGDCLAIVMQSAMWRLSHYAVGQKTHMVHGTLGYEAQLINAILTSLRVIRGRFKYEELGDWARIAKRPKMTRSAKGHDIPAPGWAEADEEGLGIRVTATLSDDDEPRQHTLWMVQAYPRNSTLWAVNPQQQLGYLAVKQWARKYAPDAILGVYTVDEISERVIQGETLTVPAAETDAVISKLNALASDANQVSDPEQTRPEWPQEKDGQLFDSRGIPWNVRFHSSNKVCVSDGSWRVRRGYDPEAYQMWLMKLEAAKARQEPEPVPEPAETTAFGYNDIVLMISCAITQESCDVAEDIIRTATLTYDERTLLEDSLDNRRAMIEEGGME